MKHLGNDRGSELGRNRDEQIRLLADLAQFSYFNSKSRKNIVVYQQFERGQRLVAVKNLAAIGPQSFVLVSCEHLDRESQQADLVLKIGFNREQQERAAVQKEQD